MGYREMVHRKSDGKYIELKVGSGNKIYLHGTDTGYYVGKDRKIYKSGRYCSSDDVQTFCRTAGLIK